MENYTYYLSACSSSGYISFLDETLNEFKKIIVLKNISKNAKSLLFDTLVTILNDADISYDTVMRCSSSDEFDAVILKDNLALIADENLFTSDIPPYADTVDFFDDMNFYSVSRKDLLNVKDKMNNIHTRAISHLKEAKAIHDEWEKIYISNTDFEKLDEAVDALIENIFSECDDNADCNEAKNTRRFFGTLLPRGNVNFIDELTCDLFKRIFIKGRPGSGKSTLLKRLILTANKYGFDTETYYCSFDVKSLDMVIIRDLGVCIFDSTSPHEKFPCKDTDIIFDVYDIAIKHDTDEVYSDELMHISADYNSEIKKAKECIYTAEVIRQKFDKLIDADNEHIQKSIHKVVSYASLNKLYICQE